MKGTSEAYSEKIKMEEESYPHRLKQKYIEKCSELEVPLNDKQIGALEETILQYPNIIQLIQPMNPLVEMTEEALFKQYCTRIGLNQLYDSLFSIQPKAPLFIGKLIYNIRVKEGYTQIELAKKAKISKRTVERAEHGEVLSQKYIIRILKVLEEIDETAQKNILESYPIIRPRTIRSRYNKRKNKNKSET